MESSYAIMILTQASVSPLLFSKLSDIMYLACLCHFTAE